MCGSLNLSQNFKFVSKETFKKSLYAGKTKDNSNSATMAPLILNKGDSLIEEALKQGSPGRVSLNSDEDVSDFSDSSDEQEYSGLPFSKQEGAFKHNKDCLLYTSPSPRDRG